MRSPVKTVLPHMMGERQGSKNSKGPTIPEVSKPVNLEYSNHNMTLIRLRSLNRDGGMFNMSSVFINLLESSKWTRTSTEQQS